MSDLSIATRNLFARTFTNQVALRIPIFAMLMAHQRVTTQGGLKLVYDLIKDDAEDEVQWYGAEDGLDVAQSSFLEQAKFQWKYGTVPMRYGVDEEIQNHLATSETKRRDLVKVIVERGQDGFKRAMNTRFHSTSTTDAGKGFQSIPDALEHSRTYGEITTTTSANTFWNGASLATSWTDRATAMALSLSKVRTMRAVCKRYVDENSKYYLYLPEAMYSKLQGLCEGKVFYQMSTKANSTMAQFGFDSFMLYGIEVVEDSWMTLNSQTSYALLINPETFQLRLHPQRAFTMQKNGFVHQAQVAGGKDEYLARMFVAGNLCCKQPNANMWKSNVS